MSWAHVGLLLLGLALAGWNTWQHLGRTPAARRWAGRDQPWFKARNVLVIRPLIALALLAGAATGPAAASGAATVAVGLLTLAFLVVLLAFLVLPIPIPTFAQPRWYRGTHDRRG